MEKPSLGKREEELRGPHQALNEDSLMECEGPGGSFLYDDGERDAEETERVDCFDPRVQTKRVKC